MILKKNMISNRVWKNIEDLYRNNKDARVRQLNNQLCIIKIMDLFVTRYYQNLKVLYALLVNINENVQENNLVTYIINGFR